jgi:hypothetical protein
LFRQNARVSLCREALDMARYDHAIQQSVQRDDDLELAVWLAGRMAVWDRVKRERARRSGPQSDYTVPAALLDRDGRSESGFTSRGEVRSGVSPWTV